MALLLAGIDEAGYGPTLGPMCVGLTVWRLADWDQPDVTPNLWKLLNPYVSRKAPSAARAKRPSSPIAIADSKVLKRPNDATAIHPLAHLERGVFAALACSPSGWLMSGGPGPCDDAALLSMLLPPVENPPPVCTGPAPSVPDIRWCTAAEHWYVTDPTPLPVASTPDHLRIAANMMQRGLRNANASVVDMRCRVIAESEFNGIVRRTRNKADVTLMAVGEHLRRIVGLAAAFPGDTVHIVCDRLGGREHYADVIESLIPGSRTLEAEESIDRSCYWVDHQGRRIGVGFQVEAERSHMPVALASMVAKLMRELAMARFNRYWSRRALDLCGLEIKPTAGYSTDARRWLTDAAAFLEDMDRSAMVREL
ncbi:MAG: hypothetical protein GIKADHBN_02917 [Phycisphaerales bacterium]|nr:hypothetical protein [Phycisphaerales bacterium]